MGKTKRSSEDTLEKLRDELNFLKDFCHSYDQGDKKYARKIALTLRVILHDTRNSKSLLSQLQVKELIKYIDTAHVYDDKNIVSSSCLTMMQITEKEARVIPRLKDAQNRQEKEFSAWWDQIVLDDKTHKFARKDIVLLTADTDGGAHVDPTIPQNYHELTRSHSMGWKIKINGIEKPVEDFCLASIRQVGFEIIETLDINRIDLWRI